MAELIGSPAPDAQRAFTAQRRAGDTGSPEIENDHRYLLAREFCRGRDVLDVFPGETCGAALLAQVAQSVVGVAIQGGAVLPASQQPNLRFEAGEASALRLPDASVDVAVSFGTLDHIADHDEFLAELHRVLRPGGLMIVSTPHVDTSPAPGRPASIGTTQALTARQFQALLQRHFSHHAAAAQRAIIGSLILRPDQGANLRAYERPDNPVTGDDNQFYCAPVTIGFASDAPLPPIANSVFINHHTDLGTLPGTDPGNHQQARSNAETLRDSASAREALVEGRAATQAAGSIAELERRLQAAQSRLAAVEASIVWRITMPLRGLAQRFPLPARTLRRLAKLVWYACTFQLAARYRARRDWLRAAPPTGPLSAVSAPRAPKPTDIAIAVSAEPVVSIIIPTYGQVALTLACLNSIAQHAPSCPIEVILIDDAYPGPENVDAFNAVSGVKVVRNAANLGFLRSCNHAAGMARGRYLYLLNNDTELRAGAIDTLAHLLESRPDVGIAGSKLLFADGRLQEAGGILWRDASGWNYGRGDDPSRPDYNYLREVDYCSGASIMLRRSLFESLGGFDVDLAPAYYEDVDLALRVRAQGLKILYEPRSVVVHHEGMSHGTDVNAGVKAHQVINQAHILQRWHDVLAREHFAGPADLPRARDHGRFRRTILIADHYVPEPDRDAGSRSTMGIIDSLADAGWIVKFWPHNRAFSGVYTEALERRGVEVVDGRRPGDIGDWLRDNGATLDHLLLIRPHVAADLLPQIIGGTEAVLSFYGIDLHCARLRHQAAQPGQTGAEALLHEATQWEAIERRVWRRVDVVIYPSAAEADTVRHMSPHALVHDIVPFCFPVFPPRTAPPTGRTILFVAGFAHPPNIDAAEFLVRSILPPLERQLGPIRLVLAGSHPTEAVKALASPNIEVTGYVSDEALSQLYDRHRVAIVPLRFGAGVKGKVVEALSRGLPLVTTSTGAQGIPGLGGVVPVHDDVPNIVASLTTLLTDDAAWLSQSLAQSEFAQRCFSAQAVQRSVLSALEAGEAAVRGHAGPTAGG